LTSEPSVEEEDCLPGQIDPTSSTNLTGRKRLGREVFVAELLWQSSCKQLQYHTVDGRNPAPLGM